MINVWMPVYNEERFIQRAIESVLDQSFTDFRLLISDNHSTDGTAAILRAAAARDARIKLFAPPTHLAGMDHGDFNSREVLPSEPGGKYAIYIGGHDVWDRDLLRVLVTRAEAEPDCAIVYTDCYEIDDAENRLRHFEGIFQTKAVPRPFVPLHVLLSINHNIVWGGLWRESMRRAVRSRHACSAADHLLVAEAALQGTILFQSGSAVYLRAAPNAGSWDAYVRKHIPAAIRQYPILDFLNQLEWCDYLIEKATAGTQYAQEEIKSTIKSSLFSAYIFRYMDSLQGYPGGVAAFFSHPQVVQYLRNNVASTAVLRELIASRTQAYPV